MSYTRLVGIGAFVLGGLALFAFGLFLIGNRRNMFTSRFEVYAEFTKMAALQRGGKVRVAGMDAGEVDSITVPSRPTGKFRVKMFVRGDLHQLVRNDSVASIQTDGIVGNKFVEIDAGSDVSPQVADGATIIGKDPFEFADLLDQASNGITAIMGVINDLKGNAQQLLIAATGTANTANKMMQESSPDVKAMTASARQIARNLQDITANINRGKGSLGKLMNDEELYTRIAGIAKQAEEISTQLKATVTSARETIDKFNGKGGGMQSVQSMQADLQQTLTYARGAMANLEENTESLKRNFLFRGLFNERGFYRVDAIAPDAYREGNVFGEGREPLRIYLGAAILFAPAQTPAQAQGKTDTAAANTNARDPLPVEVLTEEGRRRIDKAIATFLRYPADSPLMVEGYSPMPTSDLALLQSRARAALVRDYIVGRFGLNINRVGTVPLGASATDSPSSDGNWDGVGLALWVRRDAFTPAPGVEKTQKTQRTH
jgi:phospholipid/cholesterol/gamma-HCH transport system substrate-binding protein